MSTIIGDAADLVHLRKGAIFTKDFSFGVFHGPILVVGQRTWE
jgi:hypothetical protein